MYGLPQFSEDDRHLYFDLSAAEHAVVTAVHTVSVAAHLTLQLGYFKAKRQFFTYNQDAVQEDLLYILKRHFSNQDLTSIKPPSRPTRVEQQRIILQLFNYRLCDSGAKLELEGKAQRIAMLSTQPVYILRDQPVDVKYSRSDPMAEANVGCDLTPRKTMRKNTQAL